MHTLLSDETLAYDGSQLRGGWLAERFGMEPDAVAAFTGPCDVAREHMIDLEDLDAGEVIRAREMLHFVVEHADAAPPRGGIPARTALRQRLLVTCAREALEEGWSVGGLRREGDDLFVSLPDGKRKLTVSVATRSGSRGTGLIHLGVNIDPEGAPVPAVGLAELGVEARELAGDVMRRYARETDLAAHAVAKVREAP